MNEQQECIGYLDGCECNRCRLRDAIYHQRARENETYVHDAVYLSPHSDLYKE